MYKTHVRKGLVAAFVVAHMRLLAGVGARVDGKGAALDEAFVAVGHGAVVRALVGMDAIMATQIRLAIEGLETQKVRVFFSGGRIRKQSSVVPCRISPTSN